MLRSPHRQTYLPETSRLRPVVKSTLSLLPRHRRSPVKPGRLVPTEAGAKTKTNQPKNTKKSATPEQTVATPKVPQPAPRIDLKSNISVRSQQRWVKAKKANEAAASQPQTRKVTKVSYRKDKLDAEERAEYNRQREVEAAEKAKFKSERASLVNLYGTKGNEQPPVLLVDGYNVLMHWQKTFPEDEIAQAFLEAARLKLEEDLITYSQRRQVKVVVVYDAMQRAADPVHVDIRTSVRETKAGLIDVVFCSDQEADTWILKESIILKQERSCPHVLVASGDRVLGDSVTTHGAFMTPSSMLIHEVKQAVKEVNLMMKESQFSYGPSSLSSVMSATDKHRIEALRQRRVETDRARAGIPVSLQNPSVPVRFPKRDNAS